MKPGNPLDYQEGAKSCKTFVLKDKRSVDGKLLLVEEVFLCL